ncbi:MULTISPECIES: shikimate kinase [Arthrobacter]|uniref:Shikimate kinase n=2 Tax=Arthrobacter TaxID=1663 RepID=A0ABU9KGP5_9MICC|nr:shikimate kinase [Arthrobacter sp. YJM1]MDP5226055.1 shikimate kinase [Arthrobacter sp. YJM1]
MPGEKAEDSRPIVLIGPMAAGKSAVGQALAALLHGEYLDSDEVFVRENGAIADYFAKHGEDSFRELEAEIVARAISGQLTVSHPEAPRIISLGGGSLGSATSREVISRCHVVYLEADLATVLPRIARDTGRPMLAGDAAERWLALFDQRRPLYESVAQLTVDVRHGSPEDFALEIARALDLPGITAKDGRA